MMRQLTPLQNTIFRLGALLMVGGLAAFIAVPEVALWVYAAGALAFGAMQCVARYEGRNVTILRLRRQQMMGACFLVGVAVCMAMQVYHFGTFRRNEWVVALAIGCILQLYTAWRIPQELEKES